MKVIMDVIHYFKYDIHDVLGGGCILIFRLFIVLIVIHISVNNGNVLQVLDCGFAVCSFVHLVPTVVTHIENIDSYKWLLV